MPNTATTTATGYPLPGFPMRPAATGLTLTPDNVVAVVRDIEAHGWLVAPKLNGDRVLLAKRDGIVTAWNRLGNRYSFSINATADWRGLPDGTVLDGEGWQGRFYPFEAVKIGSEILSRQCVTVRANAAKDLCRTLGNGWLFDRPTDAWLRLCRENLPAWEGIVAKLIGSHYIPLRKSFWESETWLKMKW